MTSQSHMTCYSASEVMFNIKIWFYNVDDCPRNTLEE